MIETMFERRSRLPSSGDVPLQDHLQPRVVRVEAENAQRRRCGLEDVLALHHRQTHPAGAQAAEPNSPWGKERDVPLQPAKPDEEAVGATRHVVRALAVAAVAVAVPTRPVFADFVRDLAFVESVVPLGQVWLNFDRRPARAGQLAGPPRP